MKGGGGTKVKHHRGMRRSRKLGRESARNGEQNC